VFAHAGSGVAAVFAGSLIVAAATPSVPSVEHSSFACFPAVVHYTHYPGTGRGLGTLPWIAGEPASQRLVGLLWYWPEAWRASRVTQARIYIGGVSPGPQGSPSMKILWVFLAPGAKRDLEAGKVVIKGQRLDGPGKSWQQFTAIGYTGQGGAPSYASIVNLPTPGCWQLSLTAGGLHATATLQALRATP
jgi:hypothetical protein